jgi:tetratricopeptide (TPR) repeat protein
MAGSALLAAAAFVAVMVFSPVEGVRARSRPGPPRPVFSLYEQGQRVRAAMSEGRNLAAVNIAGQTAARFPDEPQAWLLKVQAEFAAGLPAEASESAERLERAVDAQGPPRRPRNEAERSYRLAWAGLVRGRPGEARERFRHAAEVYAEATEGVMSEAVRQYNLASYLAMAGEVDLAAEHFARAVDEGYPERLNDGRGEPGWWRADPDLDPIRRHRLYLDAVVVLEERERAAGPDETRRRPGTDASAG